MAEKTRKRRLLAVRKGGPADQEHSREVEEASAGYAIADAASDDGLDFSQEGIHCADRRGANFVIRKNGNQFLIKWFVLYRALWEQVWLATADSKKWSQFAGK